MESGKNACGNVNDQKKEGGHGDVHEHGNDEVAEQFYAGPYVRSLRAEEHSLCAHAQYPVWF